ncbi:hypothetical protein [Dongia sp.]|uniref:hypothetical protein n=1 Tax=Dongia sp. TaxID=1977262 RepID=UPI0035B31DB5
MKAIEDLRQSAASVAVYYDVLTRLFDDAEAKAGVYFDREWHCSLIATAAMYLAYQRGAEFFSVMEATVIRDRLHNTVDGVYLLLGHNRVSDPMRDRPNKPEIWPDPFE